MKRIFLTILLVTSIAQAETYTWTDSEGTVHFSDSPGGAPAQVGQRTKPTGMNPKTNPANSTAVPAPSGQLTDVPGAVTPDMDALKERMTSDEGTMALIRSLQNIPEMQAILNDPAIIRALQAGDFSTLTSSPAFLKLLNNPQVREIENRVQRNWTR